MARNNHIVYLVWIVLLLSACGQVGTITGGPVDNSPPKPLSDQVEPPMASKNVSPEKIIIPFDEYITLNKPAQNISVIPRDVTLEPTIKQKSLVLTPINGEWKENTTYAIYLNRAVQDITESNDSLMVYVFSTGNVLDSLEAAVKVVDAFSNNALKDITVGLYEDPLSDDTSKVEPRYIASTDESGIAHFQYLKKGSFYVYAFEDENKNSRLDSNEKRAGLDSTLQGDTSVTMGPVMRLMPPADEGPWEITSNEVNQPANWCLGFSEELSDTVIFYFPEMAPIETVWNARRDSVTHYFLNRSNSGAYSAIIVDGERRDTINKKYFFKTPFEHHLESNLSEKKLLAGDTLTLYLKEPILEIDTSKISAVALKKGDSTWQPISYNVQRNNHRSIHLVHDRTFEKIKFTLAPESLNGYNFAQKDTSTFEYSIQESDQVGIVNVSFDSIPPYGILYLNDNSGETVDTITFNGIDDQKVTFNNLQPGNYSFYFVIDENRDGEWTTGNLFESIPPEEVLRYPTKTTVRPNWEVEVTLTLSKDIEEY